MKNLFYEDCRAMRREERERERDTHKMKHENVPGASIIQ